MAKKPRKTDRDELSDGNKMLTRLLQWEASGGMIPLPKGAEGYVPPAIPFEVRRALIDTTNKELLVDAKINPEAIESTFDTLKEDLNERNRKRSESAEYRGAASSHNGARITDDDSDDIFAGGSAEH